MKRLRGKPQVSLQTRKFQVYKYNARKRNLPFTLTFFEFLFLIEMPCDYCGATTEIGLDRVNNNKGYTRKNTVSCCYICNFAKYYRTPREFIEHCKKVTLHNERSRRPSQTNRKRKARTS